jgi:hypothetical protein
MDKLHKMVESDPFNPIEFNICKKSYQSTRVVQWNDNSHDWTAKPISVSVANASSTP